MSGEVRRVNAAQFTRTAARFASGRVSERIRQSEALFRLASPQPDDLALDVACGPGALLAALAARTRHAVGLDLAMAMLDEARGRSPVSPLVQGVAEQLPFADGAFSLVTCTWAVHHFDDPARVLGEIARVCRPGGRVAIGDSVGSEDETKRARHNAIERLRDPAHVEMRSPSGLRALLIGAGLAPTGTAGGTESRDLEEWCGVAATPPDAAGRVREMLLATQPGDLAGMAPVTEGGRIGFTHHWVIIVSERP